MIPYFLAAGHVNYAGYSLFYLRTMQKLPGIVLEQPPKGEHIVCHQDGYWNGIWTDMMIESTYMRHGKGPAGHYRYYN